MRITFPCVQAALVRVCPGHIYRQYVDGGKYLSVDGEGILSQTTNGGDAVANLFDANDFTHAVADPTQVTI